jgi:hypothetical protein
MLMEKETLDKNNYPVTDCFVIFTTCVVTVWLLITCPLIFLGAIVVPLIAILFYVAFRDLDDWLYKRKKYGWG